MAAKGSIAKVDIFKKILDTFNGSFMNGEKELRIPWMENGELLEIKVTLTAAKDILGDCGAKSQVNPTHTEPASTSIPMSTQTVNAPSEPTEEEKERIAKLVAAMF